MTGLARWFEEAAQADIDAMLCDPLLPVISWLVREDAPYSEDEFVAIRGDDDVPWRDDAPLLDDGWWDSVGWW